MKNEVEIIIFFLQVLHFREDLEQKLIDNLLKNSKESGRVNNLENIYGERVNSELLKNTEIVLSKFGIIRNHDGQMQIDSLRLEKFIEMVEIAKASRNYNWPKLIAKPFLYISPPTLLNSYLTGDVDDISNLIIGLVSSSEMKISIMSPFTNKDGLRSVLSPLNACKKNPKIYLYLTSSKMDQEMIYKQIIELTPKRMQNNLEIYFCSTDTVEEDSLPHAKVLVADSAKGYLGSANFTRQGLTSRFELGVELNMEQSKAIEKLFSILITKGIFIKYTS